jgi:4'-phosphopantetheinyl transferase
MAALLTEPEIGIASVPSSLAAGQPQVRSFDDSPVQVWSVNTLFGEPDLSYLRSLLSAAECDRASRFRFDKDRNQFVTARGMLRILLSRYLGADSRHVKFVYSERGKPALADVPHTELTFNVAHSGNMILLAFTSGHRIGIDVERLRTDIDALEIAERFFSRSEYDALRDLAENERHLGFFLGWTRKEAYVKATGDGLSLPLNQFDVSLKPAEPGRLIATRPDPSEANRWRLENLDIHPEYAAALVIERSSAGER